MNKVAAAAIYIINVIIIIFGSDPREKLLVFERAESENEFCAPLLYQFWPIFIKFFDFAPLKFHNTIGCRYVVYKIRAIITL